jgi:hypothetical protein
VIEEHAGEVHQPGLEPGRPGLQRGLQRLLEIVEQGGVQQVSLVGEVDVQGAQRHPGLARDLAQLGGLEAALAELPARDLEQALARVLALLAAAHPGSGERVH